ncbi:MAG: HAD-IC family P-type ATPase, partial [Pirellulales bacterium]|nr:HAD-IC family P-type ATPase [Pirellulales bacterium]
MASVNEQTAAAWHTLSISDLFAGVSASETGLTSAEAESRLEEFGLNQLPQKPPPSWWQIGLRQFCSPLIYILGAAALVSLLIQHPEDAIFITAVLVLNAVIGGYQEWRAEQSSRALQKLLQVRASVQRDGEVLDINAEQVVPGDVVWLESGNRVPADLRLLSAQGLEVDESLLTGESLSVVKNPAWSGEAAVPLGDRLNMAYAGSIVARGRSKGVVVATGTGTIVGELALDVLSSAGGKAPLLERMEKFTRMIAYLVLGAAGVISLFGVLARGYSASDMFMFGVAMAVSAIPEGLPVALTVALAIAMTRMARRGVIVHRLAAVEGLGSCTLIASDKTGTLTCNELTARDIRLSSGEKFTVTGEGFAPGGEVLVEDRPADALQRNRLQALARAAVLCNEGVLHQRNDSWVWRGDPTDLALLSLGHKLGCVREKMLDRHSQVNEIPFESEHQFAATFNRVDGEVRVFVKGAPERVAAMCAWPDPDRNVEELQVLAGSMAERGMRVLAFAEGTAPQDLDPSQVPPEPTGLTFLGLVGMIDPLRPGVREAVA